MLIPEISADERTDIVSPLREYETVETAAGVRYKVRWRGSTVLALEPKGSKVPLYAHRASLERSKTPFCPPRYP